MDLPGEKKPKARTATSDMTTCFSMTGIPGVITAFGTPKQMARREHPNAICNKKFGKVYAETIVKLLYVRMEAKMSLRLSGRNISVRKIYGLDHNDILILIYRLRIH